MKSTILRCSLHSAQPANVQKNILKSSLFHLHSATLSDMLRTCSRWMLSIPVFTWFSVSETWHIAHTMFTTVNKVYIMLSFTFQKEVQTVLRLYHLRMWRHATAVMSNNYICCGKGPFAWAWWHRRSKNSCHHCKKTWIALSPLKPEYRNPSLSSIKVDIFIRKYLSISSPRPWATLKWESVWQKRKS